MAKTHDEIPSGEIAGKSSQTVHCELFLKELHLRIEAQFVIFNTRFKFTLRIMSNVQSPLTLIEFICQLLHKVP